MGHFRGAEGTGPILRVGGIEPHPSGSAHRKRASLVEMQTAGRWQSPAMPGHYARGEFAARGAVARLPVWKIGRAK